MRQKKRIRELKREEEGGFPICRSQIDAEGYSPHILGKGSLTYWDGSTVVDRTGNFHISVSPSVRKEMISMIQAGCYGEGVSDAFLDQTTYWKIRDDLITWPNKQKIDEQQLYVVDVKLRDKSAQEK